MQYHLFHLALSPSEFAQRASELWMTVEKGKVITIPTSPLCRMMRARVFRLATLQRRMAGMSETMADQFFQV